MRSSQVDIRSSCVDLMSELATGGGSLTRLLPLAQARIEASERAQLQAWVYGLARYANELEGLVNQLLKKPLKRKDQDIYWLILLGVFQLKYTTVAAHAAVNESVKVLKYLKKPWAKGLVNAVLRNYQRSSEVLHANLNEGQQLSHPDWLLRQLQNDWPSKWKAICQANNRQGPMTLRVNRRYGTRENYMEKLSASQIDAQIDQELSDAVHIKDAVPVEQLPEFFQGAVSVQDRAAQMAADWLEQSPVKDGRLLDACAAPGGKTAHILERQHFREVVAVEIDETRSVRLKDTMARLGLENQVQIILGDAAQPEAWWDGNLFDAVLIDAPCSGTGVIRRHPDIKLLRRESDIPNLVKLQGSLLHSLWSALNSGGLLLYCTCSVIKDENEHQINRFLADQTNARLVRPIVQILPGEGNMDGFFFALLEKVGGT